MIDPSEIVNNLVAMLRDIPDLVTELGGDPRDGAIDRVLHPGSSARGDTARCARATMLPFNLGQVVL